MSYQDDDQPQKTRVQEAQRECAEAKLLYLKTRHGVRDLDPEMVLTEWHTSLMGYYSEIERYRLTDNLNTVWDEPVSETLELALADISDYVFYDETIADAGFDPDTQTTRATTITQPSTFNADELRQIQIKLDECYHHLGFDEPPKRVLPSNGTIGDQFADENPELSEEVIEEAIEAVDRIVSNADD
jgi:hypothetical protein